MKMRLMKAVKGRRPRLACPPQCGSEAGSAGSRPVNSERGFVQVGFACLFRMYILTLL